MVLPRRRHSLTAFLFVSSIVVGLCFTSLSGAKVPDECDLRILSKDDVSEVWPLLPALFFENDPDLTVAELGSAAKAVEAALTREIRSVHEFYRDNGRFLLKEMSLKFRKIDAEQGLHYLTAAEQTRFEVHLCGDGKLCRENGAELDGTAIYVMNRDGRIFVGPTDRKMKHSTLAGGAAVAAAGTVRVVNGRIEFIDSWSGHYAPEPRFLLQAIERLQFLGVSIRRGAVGVTSTLLGGETRILAYP